MLVLASTDNIQVTTSSANALDVAAGWADNTSAAFTPGRSATLIAAAATTTVVAAPAASTTRNVSSLSLFARGGANTIQVQSTGGSTVQYASVTLALGERLEYENGAGWRVLDVTGALKTAVATGVAGHVIRVNDVAATQRAALNFLNTGDITFAATDDGANGETELRASYTPVVTVGGRLLRAPQVVLATNAAFAHPAGTKAIVALVIAAGGGGTGAVNSAAAQITLGGGGASGGHLFHTFTSISGTSNVTIGAAGAAGANTGAAAGTGGNSSVVHNGVTVTALGGPGAPINTTAGMAGVSAATFGASPGALPPGVSTSANLNGGGNPGGIGLRFSGTAGQSGSGGGSMFGGAGIGRTTQGAGNAAIGPGGGGAGGLSSAAGGAVTGGAGFVGAVIFWEFG